MYFLRLIEQDASHSEHTGQYLAAHGVGDLTLSNSSTTRVECRYSKIDFNGQADNGMLTVLEAACNNARGMAQWSHEGTADKERFGNGQDGK